MIDVKWDMPLSLLQRSLYLMKDDGFRVVAKGSVVALVCKKIHPRITVTLKDNSSVAMFEMNASDEQEAKVLSTLKFIAGGKSLEGEISSGRLAVMGPDERMKDIVSQLIGREKAVEAEVSDRPSGTLPKYPHHGHSHTDDDGKIWAYNVIRKQWVHFPPIPS